MRTSTSVNTRLIRSTFSTRLRDRASLRLLTDEPRTTTRRTANFLCARRAVLSGLRSSIIFIVLAVAQAAGQRLVLLHQRPGVTGGLRPRPGPRRGTDGPGAASAPRFPAFPPWLAASHTTHCLVGTYENDVAALRHRLQGGRGIRPGYGQFAESASNPQTSDPASPGTGHGRAQHGRACEHAEGQDRTPEQGAELRATGRADDDPVVAALLDELR
jgi:hypothetical protein